MQSDEELLADVRPKCQTRRPARLQDYEVDYVGDRPQDSSQWKPPPSPPPPEQAAFLPQYGPVNLSHRYSSQPPFGGFPRDAAHYKTPQVAQGHLQRRNLAMDILPGAPTSQLWSSYIDPSFYPYI